MIFAGKDLDETGLSGTVVPHDRMDLARCDGDINAVERACAREGQARPSTSRRFDVTDEPLIRQPN